MVNSVYELLYNTIKGLLPTDYKVTFERLNVTDMIGDKTIPISKETIIGLRSGINGNRVTDSGKYTQESARLVINIYTERGLNGIKEGMKYAEQVKLALDTTFNYEAKDVDSGIELRIINMSRFGNLNYVGETDQQVPIYSLNYLINYTS